MAATKRDYCEGEFIDNLRVALFYDNYVYSAGQLFTATATYTPSSVKLMLMKGGINPPITYVSIYTVPGVLVARGTINNSSVGYSYSEITVTMTTVNHNIQSGGQYYLLLEPTAIADHYLYVWKSYDVYAGGDAYTREGYVPDAAWSCFPNYDIWFGVWGNNPTLSKGKLKALGII